MNKNINEYSSITAKPKLTIKELNESRSGGQIALRGYSYQFLYSCYLMLLSADTNMLFQLEGIEDIDCIEYRETPNHTTHVQLKYSINKQNASFLKDVLKNFLETYLLDQNRLFKLVYDFPIAKGYLNDALHLNFDDKSHAYWNDVILKIKQDNPSWNWGVYDFNKFISSLSFERIEKSTLAEKIESVLIEKYDIITDNISLFANSIKIFCLEKMEQKAYVTKKDLDICIQSVKIDISKGTQNPAHSWIQRLNYSVSNSDKGHSFYEGKKATPADIVSEIPIKRHILEQKIINSIQKNTITVIKSSSGQGKTTLALQVANTLQNEYIPYQLMWCNDVQELGNIVQYFKSRIKLGEKLLIIIDNLDSHVEKWNYLAQRLQDELYCHYKLLITSREIDWYNYSGDLSNLQSLKIIKPVLNEQEAKEIFNMLKKANMIHTNILDWKKAWHMIEERQLLIEYVYLLTHGQMLSERIKAQISEISKSPSGKVKCEILRKVCFADICGIKLSITNLLMNQTENSEEDFGEILKGMESEFLVQVNNENGYIEGLHPIRSKHIIDKLHSFFPIDITAISVIKLADKIDLPVLFSHLPEFNLNKNRFFDNAVDELWNETDLSSYILALQGLFSGDVMQYYSENKDKFNDANSHGGLYIISTEICPFAKFNEFDISVETLDKMHKTLPQNRNIKYLCDLRNQFPVCDLQKTFIYVFCKCLYKKLLAFDFSEINDIESYSVICEWLYNIDSSFNLSNKYILENIWCEPEKLSLNCISTLMYISYCANKNVYLKFVNDNINCILLYLKHKTKSHQIFIDDEENAIYVKYILRFKDIKNANDESVSRLKLICKALPIFNLYCANALKPNLDLLNAYSIPDDSHKKMPINNIVIMFHQNMTSLWIKTIMSNYEFDTIIEWLEHWLYLRKCICLLADNYCCCIYKTIKRESLGRLAKKIDNLNKKLNLALIEEKRYPKEDRPFGEKSILPKEFVKIKKDYFQSILNLSNQFPEFLLSNDKSQRLVILNLTLASSTLKSMQKYFSNISADCGLYEKHLELSTLESERLESLIMYCDYYQRHSSNKYFNKYKIKDWYEKQRSNEMKVVEAGLTQTLQSQFSIQFPDNIYTIGLQKYYPIIVDTIDTTSKNDLGKFLIECIPFADAPFDYLIVLFMNDSNEIIPNALKISKEMFIG